MLRWEPRRCQSFWVSQTADEAAHLFGISGIFGIWEYDGLSMDYPWDHWNQWIMSGICFGALMEYKWDIDGILMGVYWDVLRSNIRKSLNVNSGWITPCWIWGNAHFTSRWSQFKAPWWINQDWFIQGLTCLAIGLGPQWISSTLSTRRDAVKTTTGWPVRIMILVHSDFWWRMIHWLQWSPINQDHFQPGQAQNLTLEENGIQLRNDLHNSFWPAPAFSKGLSIWTRRWIWWQLCRMLKYGKIN